MGDCLVSSKRIDIAGVRSGRLVAVRPIGANGRGNVVWLCQCDCGGTKNVIAYRLKCGCIKSCGCIRREKLIERNRKHGRSKTPVYNIWAGIVRRCTKPSASRYSYYGGRGIKVCDRWLDFENFYKDMGDRPTQKHQIDRIDNGGDYCPDNCRWATASQNARNRRSSRRINHLGENHSLTGWAEKFDKKPQTVIDRVTQLGWSIDEALSTESGKKIKQERIVEHNGFSMNLTDWAKYVGLTKGCLWRRLNNGWSVKDALETPHKWRSKRLENIATKLLVA